MAAGFRIGSAFIEVTADVDQVQRDVDEALRGLDRRSSRSSTFAGLAIGKRIGGALSKALKPMLALGAIPQVAAAVATVTVALQNLLPAALLLPGALLAAGAAMATFKTATAGFADALAGDAEALAGLSPEARRTVQAVDQLRDSFDGVRRQVQDRFFRGFADDVRDLGRTYLPVLKDGMGLVADQMNLMGRSAAKALMEPGVVRNVDRIFAGLSGTLRNARDSVGNLAAGFVNLGGIGAQYLPALGEHIDRVAERFRVWTEQGQADGSIQEMIDAAIQGFKDLGAVLGNIGSIAGSVFTGLFGEDGGATPLARLRDITGAISDMLKTAEAQDTLRTLGGILQTIGETVGEVIVTAFRDLGPPLGRLIREHGPALEEVFRFIGDVLVDVVIPAVAGFIDWLTYHAIPGITVFVLTVMSGWAQMAVTAADVVGGILTVFGGMFRVLSYLPGPFGAAFGAAADSIDGARDSVTDFRNEMAGIRDRSVSLILNSQAEQRADSIRRALEQIPSFKNVTVRVDEVMGAQVSRGRGLLRGRVSERATGGPVIGPGSGTSDTAGIFALSNGEHIWTAAETRAAGGHRGVQALRRAVLDGVLPGLAGGGAPTSSRVRSSVSAGAGVGVGGMSIGTVVIDARSVAEMQSVADFFTTVRQAARSGGTSMAGVRV